MRGRRVELAGGRRHSPWSVRLGGEGAGRIAVLLVALLVACAESVVAQRPQLRPALTLLIILYIALEHPLTTALSLSLAIGYMEDVFSGESRGLVLFATMSAFFIVRALAFRFVGRRFIVMAALGLVMTVAQMLVLFVTEATFGPGRVSVVESTPAFALRLLGAVVFAYPAYYVLKSMEGRFKARPDVLMGRRRHR
ncbi:MAG: rod shape-determining protein MreD [Deltaproteobacteria bacterium]|nr:rod shape-determining protein MreD [Deltaproteobacteria bacterium]